MKNTFLLLLTVLCVMSVNAANKYDNPDTLFVARDGTGEFRTIEDAVEVCRAFMEYHKVIYVKKLLSGSSYGSQLRHGLNCTEG